MSKYLLCSVQKTLGGQDKTSPDMARQKTETETDTQIKETTFFSLDLPISSPLYLPC